MTPKNAEKITKKLKMRTRKSGMNEQTKDRMNEIRDKRDLNGIERVMQAVIRIERGDVIMRTLVLIDAGTLIGLAAKTEPIIMDTEGARNQRGIVKDLSAILEDNITTDNVKIGGIKRKAKDLTKTPGDTIGIDNGETAQMKTIKKDLTRIPGDVIGTENVVTRGQMRITENMIRIPGEGIRVTRGRMRIRKDTSVKILGKELEVLVIEMILNAKMEMRDEMIDEVETVILGKE